MGIKMDALKKWLRANPSNKQMISNATAFNPQQIEILDGFKVPRQSLIFSCNSADMPKKGRKCHLADVAASVIGLVVLELSDQAHLKQLWRNHFRSNTCVLLR
jgi:hypothetical protein